MDKGDFEKLQALFLAAADLPAADWPAFVSERAGGDRALADRVLRMLRRDQKSSFLDRQIEAIASEFFSHEDPLPFESIGPYSLQHSLGSGGMGIVYMAERLDWASKVAIKIPRDIWISGDHLIRFQHEQRMLASLTHPGIARIYEGGTLSTGTPWFAMEFVDGRPINKYCQSEALSHRQCLSLFLAVCDAVQYAHTHAIIHRDLKPSNILVTPDGEVKLLDFGIAKQLGDVTGIASVTRTGFHPLTLAYAAPEQVLDNQISTQTDVYALGVVLYELITGKLPFDLSDLTPSRVSEILKTQEPPKPSTAATQPSAQSRGEWDDLNVLILTAMHKDLAKRYASVDAFKRDIEHYLNHEALEAREDSIPYRLSKFTRRNRLPISLAAGALAVVIGLVSFYTFRLEKARDTALAEAAKSRLARKFMQDLLQGDDNESGPSKDLRVIDLLDRGVKKASALKQDPVQQGELYTTLGSSFLGLAEYDKAASTLNSAYRILSCQNTRSHELAETLMNLGQLYSTQGQEEKGLSFSRRALAMEEQLTPPDRTLIFKYKLALAEQLVITQPYEALNILNALMLEPATVVDEETWSAVWTDFTTGYINTGQYQKAVPFSRRVLEYDRHSAAAHTPSMSADLINDGSLQRNLRNYPAAENSFREALSIDQSFYPKGHPETADIMRMLADILIYEHQFTEAESLAHQALADLQKNYGPVHRRVAFAYDSLGKLAFEQGRMQEAELNFDKELPILESIHEVTNIPRVLVRLGDIYWQTNSYTKSEEAYRKAIALYPKSLAEGPEHMADTNRKLGELLLLEHRYADAEKPLQASLTYFADPKSSYPTQAAIVRKDLLTATQHLASSPAAP